MGRTHALSYILVAAAVVAVVVAAVAAVVAPLISLVLWRPLAKTAMFQFSEDSWTRPFGKLISMDFMYDNALFISRLVSQRVIILSNMYIYIY